MARTGDLSIRGFMTSPYGETSTECICASSSICPNSILKVCRLPGSYDPNVAAQMRESIVFSVFTTQCVGAKQLLVALQRGCRAQLIPPPQHAGTLEDGEIIDIVIWLIELISCSLIPPYDEFFRLHNRMDRKCAEEYSEQSLVYKGAQTRVCRGSARQMARTSFPYTLCPSTARPSRCL